MKRILLVAVGCAVGVFAAVPTRQLYLPTGTPLRIQLETALSTGDNQVGDGFAGRVMTTVYLNGVPAIPAGSIVEGHIAALRDSRPAIGTSALLLRPDYLTLPDGEHYVISAQVTATQAATPVHVGSEGMIEGSRRPDADDARRAGVAGASGLIAGVVLAGAKGAMIGSVMGGALAGGWWLFTHRHAALNPGAEMDISLERPLLLVAQPAGGPAFSAPVSQRSAPVSSARPVLKSTPAAPSAESLPVVTPRPTVQDLTPHQ